MARVAKGLKSVDPFYPKCDRMWSEVRVEASLI
jgi:hypothetical protein